MQRKTPPQALVNLVNPLVRWLATSRLHRSIDGTLLLLHVTGRRTGRSFDIPVGYVRVDDRLLVTTQHRWRTNLRACPTIEATLRGVRRTFSITLDENPRSIASTYTELIRRYGWPEARRRLGLSTVSGDAPSPNQLGAAADAYHLAILELTDRPAEHC